MQMHSDKKHAIDLLFPIALFFVLAASSLIVVLFASGIYRKNMEASASGYESRTSLSYVAEKIRQNDERGGVSLGSFDGQEALVLSQNYDGKSYLTYIYEYDGYLRELFILADVPAKAADGQPILAVQDFQIREIEPSIFALSYTGKDGEKVSTVAAVKSNP